LSYHPYAKFSQLNLSELTNDHFSFHIKRLIKLGLIEKNPEGHYELTLKGKEFIGTIDFSSNQEEKRAKNNVMVVLTKDFDGETKYLIQKRLRHPYYGYSGMITVRIKKGEHYENVAGRLLFEQTGVNSKLKLVSIKHRIDYIKDKLVEDIVFFIFKGKLAKGEISALGINGENYWLSIPEIQAMDKVFPDTVTILEMASRNGLSFVEESSEVEEF